MSNTTVPISEWCKEIRVALARKEMNLQSVADEIGYSYTTIVLPFTIFIFNWGKAAWEDLRGE